MFPCGINSVVFLLYKAAGQGKKENVLSNSDPRYIEFLKLVNNSTGFLAMGFDSCQSPAISKFCLDIATESIEFCDSARFSMYIDCDLMAYPCSFGHSFSEFAVDLSQHTIKDAWESKAFEGFRYLQTIQRQGCTQRNCRPCALEFVPNACDQCIKNKLL